MLVPRVDHHPCNQHGRDFVVGDVHGCFRTLKRALAAFSFDRSRDRLFGVGDLVERGPHSAEALHWLERRFTAVTLGNHEAAALRWLRARFEGARPPPSGWFCSISPNAYPRWRDALLPMPLAVTIETRHGDVGVVHAESPHPTWPKALRLLECGHDLDVALFGFPSSEAARRCTRDRFVEGVRALVHGHYPVDEVECVANRWNIDTGAGIPHLNRLSIIECNAPEVRSWTFDVEEGAWPSRRQ